MADHRPINVRHSKPAFTNKFCGISGPIVTKIEMPDEDLVLVDGPPHRVISLHYNTPDGRPVHEYFEEDGPIPAASEVLEIAPLYLPQDRPTERATVTDGKLPPLESVDVTILDVLAKRLGVSLTQYDLGNAGDRKTVGKRLSYLRKIGYVAHPEGKKKGNVITSDGIARLQSLAETSP